MAEASRQVRVLVTGFGPFPGVPHNITETLAAALARGAPMPGIALFACVLPVSWEEAEAARDAACFECRPHAILHFGVSQKATGFVIETRSYNLRSGRTDERGLSFPPCRVAPIAPAMLRSSLPCADLAAALRRNGLPVRLSDDPGRYLCNMTLFSTLLSSRRAPVPPLAAFVHLPALGVDAPVAPGLDEDGLVRGARILVRTAARAVLRGQRTGSGRANHAAA